KKERGKKHYCLSSFLFHGGTHVEIHCHPSHARRERAGDRTRNHAQQGVEGEGRGYACRVPEHGLLPPHHPWHDGQGGRKTRRSPARVEVRARLAPSDSRLLEMDSLPRLDARLRHGDASRR